MKIPVFLMQGFIIFVTVVVLLLVYGVCMLLNAKATVYSSHEHMPVYVERINVIIGKIHFFVLAVPIIMFGAFAVDNVSRQFSHDVIVWYAKVTLTITLLAIIIGIIAQTIFIIRDNNANKKDQLRP